MPVKKKTSKKATPKAAKKKASKKKAVKKAVRKVAKKKTTKKAVKATNKPQSTGKSTKFEKGNTAGSKSMSPIAKHKMALTMAFNDAVTTSDVISIAKKMVKVAKTGNVKAAKEVLDRCIGKATQPVEVTGEGGGPIKTQLIIVRTGK